MTTYPVKIKVKWLKTTYGDTYVRTDTLSQIRITLEKVNVGMEIIIDRLNDMTVLNSHTIKLSEAVKGDIESVLEVINQIEEIGWEK